MQNPTILVAVCLLLPTTAQSQAAPFDLTIPNIMRGPEVYGREPSNPRFTPNGEYIYFNWLPPGTDWRETTKPYRVRAQAGARPERVTDAHMDSVGPSLAAGAISRDGTRRVASYNGDLWLTDLRDGTTRRLTDTPVITESNPTFAASGNRIYFLRDGQNVMSGPDPPPLTLERPRNSAPPSRRSKRTSSASSAIRSVSTRSIVPNASGGKARERKRSTLARTSASPGSLSRRPAPR
jgi:Tol biopolymer transport system component